MTATCEYDVTIGQIEPMKHLGEDLSSYLARKAKSRARFVKAFLADNNIPTPDDMDTDKAFIAVKWRVKKRHAATHSKKRARRARDEFRQYAVHIVDLMQRITEHLTVDHGGVIWGKDLGTLYSEIAAALNETSEDIITAIDIAVDQQLLHRQEANDELSVEWVSVAPAA